MNKTVLTELIEWILADPKITEHEILVKAQSLLPKEKEDGIDLILEGMNFLDAGIKKDNPTNREVAETVFNSIYKQSQPK